MIAVVLQDQEVVEILVIVVVYKRKSFAMLKVLQTSKRSSVFAETISNRLQAKSPCQHVSSSCEYTGDTVRHGTSLAVDVGIYSSTSALL